MGHRSYRRDARQLEANLTLAERQALIEKARKRLARCGWSLHLRVDKGITYVRGARNSGGKWQGAWIGALLAVSSLSEEDLKAKLARYDHDDLAS